ncbi:mutator type transposase [Tanacetum coccineum]
MQKKFHVVVSKDKAFRAKAKAQVHLRGDVKVQYALLRDYVCELKSCNPDTTVKIDVYGEEDPETPTRMFRRIYVCLDALKLRFRECGREFLGLDGAFMRGNSNLTFITDRQKGLLPALAKLFPSAEHRYCVRHTNENMNQTWKGAEYNKMLWCATSTTEVLFEKNMQELKDLNKKAYEWLHKIPPEHWSKAYFSGRAHCDLLINNVCEVFNRQLLDARDSLIITALEFVREYLMKRIVIVQKVIQKCNGPLTPVVAKLFDKIKAASTGCTTCSYRKWEISGIPCNHAIAIIHDMTDNGFDVGILKIRDMWSKFDCPTTLLPPKVHPQIRRPPKKRKKSKGEIVMVKGNKLTRQGKTITCSLCHPAGHNKRSCSQAITQASQRNESVLKKTTETKRTSSVTKTRIAAVEVGTQASTGSTFKRTNTSRLTPEK